MIINFANETLNALKHFGYSPNEVSYVVVSSFNIPFDDFIEGIKNVEYDNTGSYPYIDKKIVIVLNNGDYLNRSCIFDEKLKCDIEQWVLNTTFKPNASVDHLSKKIINTLPELICQ